jgi:signal peptidase I
MKNFFEKIKNSPLSKLKWLDPFTYVDVFVMPRVKKFSDNEWLENGVNLFFALIFAILIYAGLGLLFGTNSPLVIIYSESMEPVFYRGDVIGLTGFNETMDFGKEIILEQNIKNVPTKNFATPIYSNNSLEKIIFSNGQEFVYDELENSSIVVYPSYPTNLPIIHRSIVLINAHDGKFVLTKGDNKKTNPTFDQDCGNIDPVRFRTEKNCVTFYAIPLEQIQGVKFFRIPVVGCIKLWAFDNLGSLITTGKLPKDYKGIC